MNTVTRNGTLVAMGLTRATLPEGPIPEITQAEKDILNVAFGSYLGLAATDGAAGFRYFDWVITTPLLTYTYWKLAEDWGWQGNFETLGVSAALMSALGYLSQEGPTAELRNAAFIISSLFFLVIVVEVLRINAYLQRVIPEERKGNLSIIPWFFILGWGLYPLVFYGPPNLRDSVWNILDLINKPVYTLVYNDILEQIYA